MKRTCAYANLYTLLVSTAALAVGPQCGDLHADSEANAMDSEPGDVEFRLQLTDEIELGYLYYMVSRDGAPFEDGYVPIGDAPIVSFRLSGLPAGDGYSITVEAADSLNLIQCDGATEFSIAAGTATPVHVTMSCAFHDDNGAADVEIIPNICPSIETITITWNEECSVDFAVVASDLDGDPLEHTWSIDGQPIGTGPSWSIDCAAPEASHVDVEVISSDGYCTDRYARTISCDDCPADPTN